MHRLLGPFLWGLSIPLVLPLMILVAISGETPFRVAWRNWKRIYFEEL